MKISNTQLYESLDEQLDFLRISVDTYENGIDAEAKRMAVAARVLLHDTSDSTSVLKQLNLRSDMLFVSTTYQYIPANMLSYLGLFGMVKTNEKAEYIPFCKMDDPEISRKWFKVDDWWNELVIDDKSYKFTRKDIVLLLANTVGGAHVDPTIQDEYANLIYENSLGWIQTKEGRGCALDNNAAYVTMRQIAHEIIYSFTINKRILTSTMERNGCAVAVYLPKRKLCKKPNLVEEAVYFVSERFKDDPIAQKILFPITTIRKEDRTIYIESMDFTDQKNCKRICII